MSFILFKIPFAYSKFKSSLILDDQLFACEMFTYISVIITQIVYELTNISFIMSVVNSYI